MFNYKSKLVTLFFSVGITLLISRVVLDNFIVEKQQAYANIDKKVEQINTLYSQYINTFEEVDKAITPDYKPLPLLSINSSEISDILESNNIELKTNSTAITALELANNLNSLPSSIYIPTINLRSSIEEVNIIVVDGKRTWEVPENNVGTPKNPIENNTILLGHTGLYNSIFQDLNKLKIGDQIIVQNTQETLSFQVEKNLLTTVNDLQYIKPQTTSKVTLITCDGEKRRIVVGTKI